MLTHPWCLHIPSEVFHLRDLQGEGDDYKMEIEQAMKYIHKPHMNILHSKNFHPLVFVNYCKVKRKVK